MTDFDEPAGSLFVSVIKIGHVIFVSVPPGLRDEQARQLHEKVAHRLSVEQNIRGLVMDISALELVDSYTAKVLEETASVATSFGAKAVLVGLRPAVAITLVELGIDLAKIETALSLEAALKKLKLRLVSED